MTPEKPHVRHSSTLIDLDYLRLVTDELIKASGESYSYVTLETAPEAVMILCRTKEKDYVLNAEYRHPTKKTLLSLPGGTVDPDEAPEQAAARELTEETGYRASRLIFLGSSYPFPGRCSQKTHYFLAEEGEKYTDPRRDLCEIISTTRLSSEELKRKILRGEDVDGHVLTALAFQNLRGL